MRFHIKHVAVVIVCILVIVGLVLITSTASKSSEYGSEPEVADVSINDLPENLHHPPKFHKLRLESDDVISVPRVHQYCNPPDQSYTGDEGEVPPDHNLEMVHVLIRHGDRSPLHTIKNQAPVRINCRLDKSIVSQSMKLQNFLSTMQSSNKRHPGSDFKSWQLYPDEEYCSGSQLTGTGIHQHILNGEHLSFKFIQKWQLLGSNFSTKQVLIKSTEYSRTFQSAIAFLYGFLPKFELKQMKIKKSSSLLFCDKSTGLTCSCPKANLAKQASNTFCGSLSRKSSSHKEQIRKLADIYSLKPSQLPWLSAIMDILMGQSCHNIKLPCNSAGQCIDKYVIQEMWDILDKEAVSCKTQNSDFNQFSHLIMHPLLVEIVQRMKVVISRNKFVPKFILYSGHDLTLSPLLAALGIYNGMWPSYGSRIVIEFYSRFVTQTKIHYFIRILYNGLDMTRQLPFCKILVNGLCKFKHFMQFVENHLKQYGVKNYNRYCFSNP